MPKIADFNLSEQTIKNILETRELIEYNMKKLNIDESIFEQKDLLNLVKLYDDPIYLERMEKDETVELINPQKGVIGFFKKYLLKIKGFVKLNIFSVFKKDINKS